MRGLREIDRILRGDATQADALRRDGLAIPLGPVVTTNLVLAAAYGVCMGVYGLAGRDEPEIRHMVADAVKVPALFFLTLVVTFPSLYVFNALVGSRLGPAELGRMMAAALGVTVALLSAFGPIVGFFSLTTTSYPFVVLLNVAVFAVAGGFGVVFLLRTLEKLTALPVAPLLPAPPPTDPAADPGATPAPPAEPAPVTVRPDREVDVRTVFRVWLAVFALVGAQMSWVLRPFIGNPDTPFAWFRPRESSFFEAVSRSVRSLLGL